MKQRLSLGELLEALQPLLEDMTYGQLYQLTDPKRIHRAQTQVRGAPLEIYADDKTAYHIFNFKSFPSTTGLRHRGYIAFKKPRRGARPMASEKLPVEVDCDCPDYRYRWAWANKQKGAGKVGPNSLNKSLNRAPVITNPSAKPALCKHLAAGIRYIQGLIQRFPTQPEERTDVDVSWKLDQLVKWAQKRQDNYGAEVEKAKKRSALYRQTQTARNTAGPMPAAEVPKGIETEVPVPLPEPQTPQGEEPEEGENKTQKESRVVKPNSKTMNTENLKRSKAIVEEMVDDMEAELGQPGALDHPAASPDGELGGELGAELPPVEAGSEHPEDEALQLLRNISTGIDRLADELAPAADLAAEEEEEHDEEHGEHDKGDEETGVPPVEDDSEFTETMPVPTGA